MLKDGLRLYINSSRISYSGSPNRIGTRALLIWHQLTPPIQAVLLVGMCMARVIRMSELCVDDNPVKPDYNKNALDYSMEPRL